MNRRFFLRLAATAPWFSPTFGEELAKAPISPKSIGSVPPLIKAKRAVGDQKWTNFEVDLLSRHPLLLDDTIQQDTSAYGGDRSRPFEKTGFFRLEKASDRWWLVDPDGFAFLSTGVNSFRPAPPGIKPIRMSQRFGNPQNWANEEIPRLRSWGFNTAGCWSDEKLLQAAAPKIAYTPTRWPGWEDLHSPLERFAVEHKLLQQGMFEGGILPVFSEEFEQFVAKHAVTLAASKDDPWLMGWFLDNEIEDPYLDAHLSYNGSNSMLKTTCAKARQWLVERKKGARRQEITEQDRDEWAGFVYERYLSIVVKEMRKHDPNHLILSPRLTGKTMRSESVLSAIGRWCDVLCVNLYDKWMVPPDLIKLWETFCRKPVIISEWYAKGQDSGLKNQSGVGYLVQTQKDRGLFYQSFILRSLRMRSVIGWHWHRYMDNDPSGQELEWSNRNSNKGIVTVDYGAYGPAIEEMSQLNRRLYLCANYFQQRPIR